MVTSCVYLISVIKYLCYEGLCKESDNGNHHNVEVLLAIGKELSEVERLLKKLV
jgi:hypothetical protein